MAANLFTNSVINLQSLHKPTQNNKCLYCNKSKMSYNKSWHKYQMCAGVGKLIYGIKIQINCNNEYIIITKFIIILSYCENVMNCFCIFI